MDIKEVVVFETSDKTRFDRKLDAHLHVINEKLKTALCIACNDKTTDFIDKMVSVMNEDTDLIGDWLTNIQKAYADAAEEHTTRPMSSGSLIDTENLGS